MSTVVNKLDNIFHSVFIWHEQNFQQIPQYGPLLFLLSFTRKLTIKKRQFIVEKLLLHCTHTHHFHKKITYKFWYKIIEQSKILFCKIHFGRSRSWSDGIWLIQNACFSVFSHLNNYFRLHGCLSKFLNKDTCIMIQGFITLIGIKALSMQCWVRQSQAMYHLI